MHEVYKIDCSGPTIFSLKKESAKTKNFVSFAIVKSRNLEVKIRRSQIKISKILLLTNERVLLDWNNKKQAGSALNH